MKWGYIAYGCIWLASALVISVAIYVTKNGNWLWFLLIPGLVSVKTETK
jgi:hypothetical protein